MSIDLPFIKASDLAATRCGAFQSVKTPRAITFRRRWHIDGLRQLSLDADVLKIQPYRGSLEPPAGIETVIKVTLANGVVQAGFHPTSLPEVTFDGAPLVVLTRTSVETEPRFTTTRAIWSCCQTIVDPADRVRVLSRLVEHPDGLALGELARHVKWASDEPVRAVFALVVEGVLAISIDERIDPAMIVRRTNPPSGRIAAKILSKAAAHGQLALPLHDEAVWQALDGAAPPKSVSENPRLSLL